jgi:hypothetical protein
MAVAVTNIAASSVAPAAWVVGSDAPCNDQCGSYSSAGSYFACSRPTIRSSSILHGAETRAAGGGRRKMNGAMIELLRNVRMAR